MKMACHTSIRFAKETKRQLDEMKDHLGETYAQVVARAVDRIYVDWYRVNLKDLDKDN
jgi:predicted DNA-binding protein